MNRKFIYKALDKIFDILFFIFIILPVFIIGFPFFVIIKTIVTIWQPYFYRRSMEKHDMWASKHISKGFFKEVESVDFPPRCPEYGTFLGIAPWGKKSFKSHSLYDEEDDDEII